MHIHIIAFSCDIAYIIRNSYIKHCVCNFASCVYAHSLRYFAYIYIYVCASLFCVVTSIGHNKRIYAHVYIILFISVGHDRTGSKYSWYIEKIVVFDSTHNKRYRFTCGRWLSTVHDDGQVYMKVTHMYVYIYVHMYAYG